MEFRGGALAKIESSDDLSAGIRVIGARSWPALLLLGAVVVAGAVWGFAGRIPVSIDAPGLLTVAGGSFEVRASTAGQVSRVSARPDLVLTAGAEVAQIVGDGPLRVRTTAPGRVAAVFARPGQAVAQGDVLCLVERVSSRDEPLVAAVYLPAYADVTIAPGMDADIEVDSVPAGSFGRIRGQVVQAPATTEGRREVAAFLSDDDAAAVLTAAGRVRRVVVRLEGDPSTPSGYRWTRGSGPPFRISSRSSVRATFHDKPLRPVDWVFP